MKKNENLIPCFGCGQEKPRSNYHRSRLLTSSALCRTCANRRSKEWREKNPGRMKAHNKKQCAFRKLKVAEAEYENFSRTIMCRVCETGKRREKCHLSSLVRHDYICKACSNEQTNTHRRMKKRLPPKEPRPTLPDWSRA